MTVAGIWVLTGAKTGDNAQVLRIAEALQRPYEVKRIVLKPGFEDAKPRVEPSLHIMDPAASDPLLPPWPDLVIAIGRRLSLIALWIKQQSGGRTRIALLNAPKGRAEDFDLLVVPAHYSYPDGPKVCRIGLPLIAADRARLDAGRTRFSTAYPDLVRPLHVLLLGGDMGDRKLDAHFATSTLRTIQESMAGQGSVFVSTSRRTPADAVDAVARALRPQDRLYRWREADPDNPYPGLLATGESFTVTSDSLSMLTEVARLGKPLVIAEPEAPLLDWRGGLRRLLGRSPRDVGGVAQFLIRDGHAVRLGDMPRPPIRLPADDTRRVASQLLELIR